MQHMFCGLDNVYITVALRYTHLLRLRLLPVQVRGSSFKVLDCCQFEARPIRG